MNMHDTSASVRPRSDALPYPDADLAGALLTLTDAQRERFNAIRTVIKRHVEPVSVESWLSGELPSGVLQRLAESGLVDLHINERDSVFRGLVQMEIARADVSISTSLGVHAGLVGAAISRLGSPWQREAILPKLLDASEIGAFALTEPDHGSDVARGLATTAERTSDGWIVRGAKRWIGNGTHADWLLTIARNLSGDGLVALLVPRSSPGVSTERIGGKIAARSVQNATITFDNVDVPDRLRIPGIESFASVAGMLARSRLWVAWQATGVQFAAFDVARAYALEREQFGRPIASFQLMQEQLSRIIGNATASLGMCAQLARVDMLNGHELQPEQASLAKATVTRMMRESVALGRGILGGNGILIDRGAAKLFADAEAIYSWEGTYEVNALIVGRAVTGISAFV